MLTRADMAKRIITARVALLLQQSHTDDISRHVTALRDALVLAFQRDGQSRFALHFSNMHVKIGKKLSDFDSNLISDIEDWLLADVPVAKFKGTILEYALGG
jgi:hypothetical protein